MAINHTSLTDPRKKRKNEDDGDDFVDGVVGFDCSNFIAPHIGGNMC